jgi:hypothetical protein
MFPFSSLSYLMAMEEDRQRQLERLYCQHRTVRRARPARRSLRRLLGRGTVRAKFSARRRHDYLAAA